MKWRLLLPNLCALKKTLSTSSVSNARFSPLNFLSNALPSRMILSCCYVRQNLVHSGLESVTKNETD